MSEMMWCGSISHGGLTGLGSRGSYPREGDWACHQLGMAISAVYDATHGATLSAVWGSWARYVCDADIARFAAFARAVFGIRTPDARQAAQEGICRTEDFFRALGMPTTLSALLGQAPEDAALALLTEVCTRGRTRTVGNFRCLDAEDVYAIYRNARD